MARFRYQSMLAKHGGDVELAPGLLAGGASTVDGERMITFSTKMKWAREQSDSERGLAL